MSTPFIDLLLGLARHRGVQGGLIVSERDGIVVDAHVQIGVRTSVVAALAASIYRKARQSAGAAGLGAVTYLELVADERAAVHGRARRSRDRRDHGHSGNGRPTAGGRAARPARRSRDDAVVERWIESPLRQFVEDAQVCWPSS